MNNATLHSLFDAVADLPLDQQRAALQSRTQNSTLIDHVLRMCGHLDDSNTEIFAVIGGTALHMAASLGDELNVGDKLGTWKLLDKIGQGGMGSVFLAERTDGHFDQTVAIKVMHGLPTPDARARLTQERQILAQLNHPNIARLFDGGATPSGQPYLVMEHIQGTTIDAYCAENNLSSVQRLQLVLPICEAVAVAHQSLIIHCDIKPSNILVNRSGLPTLLDFGIASLVIGGDAIEGTPAEGTPAQAAKSQAHAHTPRYASPEQKANKRITTASDIYSLGRLIEELCIEAIPATSARKLSAQELRAIVDKACAPTAAARYGSALGLAADIKKLLAGHQVEAAAAIPGYTSRKWFKLHWPKVAAAVAFLALIGGFSIKVNLEKNRAELQAVIAEEQRAKAQSERQTATQATSVAQRAQAATEVAKNDALLQRDKAEDARKQALSAQQLAVSAKAKAEKSEQQAVIERNNVARAQKSTETVNNFLVSIFDGVNPSAGGNRNASARDVVARAEKKLDELKTVAPEAQAKLFDSLADIHYTLGDQIYSAQYYSRAADAYGQAGEKFNAERVDVLRRAAARLGDENNAQALAIAQQAVALGAKDKARAPLVYAQALNGLVGVLHQQTRFQEAKLVVEEIEQIYAVVKTDPWLLPNYASFRHNAAYNKYHLGNYAAAEVAFKQLMDFGLTRVPVSETSLGNYTIGYANALKRQGKLTEAEAQFRQSLARVDAAVGGENTVYFSMLGNFSVLLTDMRKYDEAEALLAKAEAIALKNREKGGMVATILSYQAYLSEARGQRAVTIALLERTGKLYAEAQGELNNGTASGLIRIARLYLAGKAIPEARAAAERALAMRKQMLGSGGGIEGVLSAQRALADIERADNNPAKAIEILTLNVSQDGEATANTQFNNRMALSRAWAAMQVAAKTTEPPAKTGYMRASAIQYAQAALAIAEKSGGSTSTNYKNAETLLSSLTDTARSSSPRLDVVGRGEAGAATDGVAAPASKVDAAITDLRKPGSDTTGKISAKTVKPG